MTYPVHQLSLAELMQFNYVFVITPRTKQYGSTHSSQLRKIPNDDIHLLRRQGFYYQKYAEKLGIISDDSIDAISHIEFNNSLASYE